MQKSLSKKSLLDGYKFIGFKTSGIAKGKLGDKYARVLRLSRRSKKVYALSAGDCTEVGTTEVSSWCEIFPPVTIAFILKSRFAGFSVRKPV
jgi:hypothetical protein